MEATQAHPDEAEGIIDDLLSNAPGAEIIMLIKHNEGDYISVSMRSTTNSADVGKICKEMGGGGHVRAAGYKVRDGRTVEQVTQEILKTVEAYQAQRLNLHTHVTPEEVKINKATLKKTKPAKKKEEKTADKKAGDKKVTALEFKVPETSTPPVKAKSEVKKQEGKPDKNDEKRIKEQKENKQSEKEDKK